MKFGFDHPSAYSAPAGQRGEYPWGPRPPVHWVGGVCCTMFNQNIFLIVKERDSFVIHLIWLIIGLVNGRCFTFIVTNIVRMSAGPFGC